MAVGVIQREDNSVGLKQGLQGTGYLTQSHHLDVSLQTNFLEYNTCTSLGLDNSQPLGGIGLLSYYKVVLSYLMMDAYWLVKQQSFGCLGFRSQQ